MNNLTKTVFGLAGFLLLVSSNVSASLIGDEITVTNIFDGGTFEGPTTVTADNTGTPEITNFGGLWDIDYQDSSIHMTCGEVVSSPVNDTVQK